MAIEGLRTSADNLDALMARDPRPALGLFKRRMSSLRTAWDEFAKPHEALFGVVADDKMDDELAVFHTQSTIYDEALDKATVFEAGYREPIAVPPSLEVKMEDLLLWRTTSYNRAEEKVDGILEVLEATETPPALASIQAQLQMLDDVEGSLGTASTLTDQ